MAYALPLDNVPSTLDSYTVLTLEQLDTAAIDWSATTLDSMDSWGALDTWNFGALDSITEIYFFHVSGSETVAITGQVSNAKILKSISGNASISVTSASDAKRVQFVSASVTGASSVSAIAKFTASFGGSADISVASTGVATLVRQAAGSETIVMAMTANTNFLLAGQGAVSFEISASGYPSATLSYATITDMLLSASATGKILGEDWVLVDSDNESWTDIAVGSEIWTQVPTGSEVWLRQ